MEKQRASIVPLLFGSDVFEIVHIEQHCGLERTASLIQRTPFAIHVLVEMRNALV
jgi:hypothetical protein